jgi:hypothetical protein
MCLGLNQGLMSNAFKYYPLAEVGRGTWLGEEAFYQETDNLSYSIKCKTNVKVLEIGLIDFKDKMPLELTRELKQIALKKKFSKLLRKEPKAV